MKLKKLLFPGAATALLLALAVCLLSLAACAGAPGGERASYPAKAITLIVPYGAGGTTDLVGRQLAIQLQKQLGQPVTVINQGGASGAVGTKTVLDASPDGYTLLFSADSLGTQRVMGLSEMSYEDFSPLLAVVNDPKVIVVNKNSPYHTIQELLADMQARPGRVKMSHTGPGGSGHVQGLIYQSLGYRAAMTAYGSGSECIVAVLGEQVDFTNANYSTVAGYIRDGELRLLAVSGAEPLAAYPDIPALATLIPGSEQLLEIPFTPLSLLVGREVPAPVQEVLQNAAQQAVETQEWKDYVSENCLEELYKKYPDQQSIRDFYHHWESTVSWLIYDAGAAKYSPEQFGIPRNGA